MDYTNLQEYVGAPDSDAAFVEECWDEATALVNVFVGAETVPVAILDRAFLEVGSELYHRRQAPNGIAQFASMDGSPVRVARDPMLGAYPLLQRFMTPGLA